MSADLAELEAWAAAQGLLLRLQVSRPLGLWTLRVGVAQQRPAQAPLLLGELKGWALPTSAGLHLDTLRVQAQAAGQAGAAVGSLIWAATFAWALENTPCRTAQLLAIRDEERQHRRLVRYFRRLGFRPVREVEAGPLDLALRMVWGGSGLLMHGDCQEGLRRSERWLGIPPGETGRGTGR